MATFTYTIKGEDEILGYVLNSGLKYRIKETANEWKLINDDGVKIELKWSKKDFDSYEDFLKILEEEGFVLEK